MATQYDGIDDFPTSFELPDDNDDLDAASVNVGFEALADRTVHLKATIDSFARRGGAILVRHVANAAALKTVVVNNDLEVAIVEDEGALYVYHQGLTGTDEPGWSVVSSVPGQGTWLNVVRSSRGSTEGKLVALDSNGRIPASHISNRIVSTGMAGADLPSKVYDSNGSSYAGLLIDVPGVQANDVILLDAHAHAQVTSGTVGELYLSEGALGLGNVEWSHTHVVSTNLGAVSMHGRYVATDSRTHQFRLYGHRKSGAGSMTVEGVASIRVQVIRP